MSCTGIYKLSIAFAPSGSMGVGCCVWYVCIIYVLYVIYKLSIASAPSGRNPMCDTWAWSCMHTQKMYVYLYVCMYAYIYIYIYIYIRVCHVYTLPVLSLSYACPISVVTCLSYFCPISVPYLSYVRPVSILCLSHICHMSVLCLPYACPYLSCVCPMSVLHTTNIKFWGDLQSWRHVHTTSAMHAYL